MALACDAGEPVDRVGVDTQAIIGGTVDENDPAVVLVGGCTGTLIAPNVVLWAAHCGQANRISFGPSYDQIQTTIFAERTVIYRGYDSNVIAGGPDIALVKLRDDAPSEIEPIPINDEPLDSSFEGLAVRAVGYGNNYTWYDEQDQEWKSSGWGVKRQVDLVVAAVQHGFLMVGDAERNTCQGDSGGPTFARFDGVEHVVGVTSYGQEGCRALSYVTRVDVFVDSFIYPVMDAWSGPCKVDGVCVTSGCRTPDPDCDPCGFEGSCATGCSSKDLDCPLGLPHGQWCEDREDCEGLLCIAAPDDSRVKYCSAECDPERPEDNYGCSPPLTRCEANGEGVYECHFSGITPSVQGASCSDDSECRSGVCHPDDQFCVEECGAGLAECADPFVCDAVGSVDACVLPKEKGCSATHAGRGAGSGAWLWAIFVVLLVGVGKKRRISASH